MSISMSASQRRRYYYYLHVIVVAIGAVSSGINVGGVAEEANATIRARTRRFPAKTAVLDRFGGKYPRGLSPYPSSLASLLADFAAVPSKE
jgi:hypothetical protein